MPEYVQPKLDPRLEIWKQILREHLPDLKEGYGVQRLWLFGSYVRGEQRKRSDLDILVEFDERSLTLLQFVALQDYLSDLLSVKVDLVMKTALKPAIGKRILQEIVPL